MLLLENLIIAIAMRYFTPTYHDYPMESKSTAPITAYYDPNFLRPEDLEDDEEVKVKFTRKLTDRLAIRFCSDLENWGTAELIWKF